MARKNRPAVKGRVIIKGIEHGLSGYTNYGCRCDACTEANSEHNRQYRNRRFAGEPLCIVPGCAHKQSRSYGNGLCWNHSRQRLDYLEELEGMSRLGLKRVIRNEGLDIKVLKRHTDDDIREKIINELGAVGLAEMAA